MEDYQQAIHQARFLQKSNWIDAVRVLEEAIVANADVAELHIELAHLYYQRGSSFWPENKQQNIDNEPYLKKALSCFHKALKLEPNDPSLLFKVGNIYLEMNEPRLALHYYEKITDDFPDALYNKAIAFEQNKEIKKAIKTLKELLYYPNVIENAYYFLIELLVNDESIEEAKQYLEIAENSFAENANLHYLKGIITASERNYFIAYYELLKTLPEYNQNAKVAHLLGLSADAIGLTKEAILHLKDAIMLRTNARGVYYDLLNILLKNNYVTDKNDIAGLIKISDENIQEVVMSLLDILKIKGEE